MTEARRTHAAAALVLSGCVPGTATITAKPSELDKAMDGGIGWVKVVEHQEKEFPNETLTELPEKAAELGLAKTNCFADVVGVVFRMYDKWIPLFLQKDKRVTYGYAVTNGKVRVWLDAELMAPIGRTDALAKAALPNLLQLEIHEDKGVDVVVPCGHDRSSFNILGALTMSDRSVPPPHHRESMKFMAGAMMGQELAKQPLGRYGRETNDWGEHKQDGFAGDFLWSLFALVQPYWIKDWTARMQPGEGRHKLAPGEYGGVVIVPVK